MGEFLRILIELFNAYFIPWQPIQPDEQGVRISTIPFRLGRWKTLRPSMHFYFPVLQTIDVYTVSYTEVDCILQSLHTADGKKIILSANVGYTIRDAGKMAMHVQDAHRTIERAARRHMFAETMTRTWEELVRDLVDVQTIVRRAIREESNDMNWGLNIKRVGLTDLQVVRPIRVHNDSFTSILPLMGIN